MAFFDFLSQLPISAVNAATMSLPNNMTQAMPQTQDFGGALAQFASAIPQAIKANQDRQYFNDVFAANPQFAQQYFGTLNQTQQIADQRMARAEERKRELDKREALRKLSQNIGTMTPTDALTQYAAIDPENGMKMLMAQRGIGSETPSSIREWQMFNSMTPEQQAQYLNMKRSQQVVNLGGYQAVLNPMGGVKESYTVTPKTTETPEYQAAQAAATEKAKLEQQLATKPQIEAATAEAGVTGKALGEAKASLADYQASYPQLVDTTARLYELADVATYTDAGQIKDYFARQFNMVDVDSPATARARMESIADNQIIPLLKQTFGAQFTENEGQWLKRTLVDPNLSPAEKKAQIQEFMRNKAGTIETLKRRAGNDYQAVPSRYTEGQSAVNPATGEKMIYQGGKWIKQ